MRVQRAEPIFFEAFVYRGSGKARLYSHRLRIVFSRTALRSSESGASQRRDRGKYGGQLFLRAAKENLVP